MKQTWLVFRFQMEAMISSEISPEEFAMIHGETHEAKVAQMIMFLTTIFQWVGIQAERDGREAERKILVDRQQGAPFREWFVENKSIVAYRLIKIFKKWMVETANTAGTIFPISPTHVRTYLPHIDKWLKKINKKHKLEIVEPGVERESPAAEAGAGGSAARGGQDAREPHAASFFGCSAAAAARAEAAAGAAAFPAIEIPDWASEVIKIEPPLDQPFSRSLQAFYQDMGSEILLIYPPDDFFDKLPMKERKEIFEEMLSFSSSISSMLGFRVILQSGPEKTKEAIEVGEIQIPGLRGLAKFVREFVAAKPSIAYNLMSIFKKLLERAIAEKRDFLSICPQARQSYLEELKEWQKKVEENNRLYITKGAKGAVDIATKHSASNSFASHFKRILEWQKELQKRHGPLPWVARLDRVMGGDSPYDLAVAALLVVPGRGK